MTNEKVLEEVENLLNAEKAELAKSLFDKLDEDYSLEYFLLKGKIAQKYQNWSEAINAYNRVLEIDPSCSEAKSNLHLIDNILNFWNPDLLNP